MEEMDRVVHENSIEFMEEDLDIKEEVQEAS